MRTSRARRAGRLAEQTMQSEDFGTVTSVLPTREMARTRSSERPERARTGRERPRGHRAKGVAWPGWGQGGSARFQLLAPLRLRRPPGRCCRWGVALAGLRAGGRRAVADSVGRLGHLELLLQPVGTDEVPGPDQHERHPETGVVQVEEGEPVEGRG